MSASDPVAELGFSRHGVWMQAELQTIEFQEGEIWHAVVTPGEPFCITVRIEVGIKGEPGADAFKFEVCSPEYLALELESHSAMWGSSRLIMKEFDTVAIEAHVQKRLRHDSDTSWEKVAHRVGQWARWEFADYKP